MVRAKRIILFFEGGHYCNTPGAAATLYALNNKAHFVSIPRTSNEKVQSDTCVIGAGYRYQLPTLPSDNCHKIYVSNQHATQLHGVTRVLPMEFQ